MRSGEQPILPLHLYPAIGGFFFRSSNGGHSLYLLVSGRVHPSGSIDSEERKAFDFEVSKPSHRVFLNLWPPPFPLSLVFPKMRYQDGEFQTLLLKSRKHNSAAVESTSMICTGIPGVTRISTALSSLSLQLHPHTSKLTLFS